MAFRRKLTEPSLHITVAKLWALRITSWAIFKHQCVFLYISRWVSSHKNIHAKKSRSGFNLTTQRRKLQCSGSGILRRLDWHRYFLPYFFLMLLPSLLPPGRVSFFGAAIRNSASRKDWISSTHGQNCHQHTESKRSIGSVNRFG